MIDFERLYNWLSFYELEIRGFKCEKAENSDKFKLSMEIGYHCSGHATAEELEKMIREIEPEILVPVHTQNPLWFERKFGDMCKVIT